MKTASSVCVVGSTNIDIVCQVKRFPLPGETVSGLSSFTCFGGKGGNQAVMAAKQGANVSLIGKIGNDTFGEDCLRNYREQNVQTDFLFRSEKLFPLFLGRKVSNLYTILLYLFSLLRDLVAEMVDNVYKLC